MKPIQGTRKASKFKPKDFISNMPDNVVTDIMDRLPLKDAVRTCILSRNWRFKWNMLSQLVFDWKFFDSFEDAKDKTDVGKLISRILLQISGSITKFVLSIEDAYYSVSVEEEISYWILFLSRKGIKDLTLEKRVGKPLKLPSHLLSCMELTRLELVCCCIDLPASFHGFPNLLSLDLHRVELGSGKLAKFLTQYPLLENLNISHRFGSYAFFFMYRVKLKLAEIAKLANLKKLSLLLCLVDKTSSSSILELVSFLPKLQELRLDFLTAKFTQRVAEMRCPTTFPWLKTLNLSDLDISSGIGLSYALQMIRSFPNLQTLEIRLFTPKILAAAPTPEICSLKADYNTMRLPQLRSVVITFFKASEKEVCLIKYLLACSPVLKKISFDLDPYLKPDEKFTLAKKLLKLHRASSEVDIDVH